MKLYEEHDPDTVDNQIQREWDEYWGGELTEEELELRRAFHQGQFQHALQFQKQLEQ